MESSPLSRPSGPVSGEPGTKGYVLHEALLFANEVRRNLGQPALDELPKGKRRLQECCPLARATGCRVGPIYGGGWRLETPEGGRVVLPYPVQVFARYFDNGAFPDLVEA